MKMQLCLNLLDAAKAVLRGKVIATKSLPGETRTNSKIQPNFTLQWTRKRRTNEVQNS